MRIKIKDIFKKNPCYPVFGTENIKNHDFLDFVEQITSSGVKIIQFREKILNIKDFINLAIEVVKICHKNDCLCIIDDRIDIALATNADGVHIGQSDMPYHFARNLLGYDKIIGLSLDFEGDIETANELDLDYVAVNGIFHSNTKNIDNHIWGVQRLENVKQKIKHPIVTIGGINEQNINQISGLCSGFAVVSDICESQNPRQKIINLVKKFQDIGL